MLYYFVKGASVVSDAEIRRLGLPLESSCNRYPATMEASGGVLLYHGDDVPPRMDAVGWRNMKEITGDELHADVFLGFVEGKKPGPADLLRRKTLAGNGLKLADGNTYQIPVALAYTDDGAPVQLLPGAISMQGGRWMKVLHDEYRALTIQSISLVASLTETGGMGFDPDFAVKVLALNYRIGPAEVSVLGLFDYPDTPIEIVKAFCDVKGFLEVAKKKASSG